jgi:hypothetical protein
MESVRLILAVLMYEGWRVHHMDVKYAFLNGDLDELVFVKQPPRFTVGKEEHVLKLKKALYRPRQAPWVWYSKLHCYLNSLGFTRSDNEHIVYTRRTNNRPLVVGVYVDDLLITEALDDDITQFKQEMHDRFKMSDLGIEVCQGDSSITLCQSAYV